MAKVFTEECLRGMGSKFELVLLAVHRTREILNRGEWSEYSERTGVHSPEVLSLKEISQHRLDIDSLRQGLMNELVAAYRESHLVKFVGRKDFDITLDSKKVFQDLFKDSPSDYQDSREESKDDPGHGDEASRSTLEEQKGGADEKHHPKGDQEDDVIAKIMQSSTNTD